MQVSEQQIATLATKIIFLKNYKHTLHFAIRMISKRAHLIIFFQSDFKRIKMKIRDYFALR